jgi:peptide/nickel transport system substrate-binding protein
MKKPLYIMLLAVLVVSIFVVTVNIRSVKAAGTIQIKADGSIDPPTAPILPNGDVYTLTDNIVIEGYVDGLVIGRSNMLLDGAGHTLLGSSGGKMGIVINAYNVTVKDTEISTFFVDVSLGSSNNVLSKNVITGDRARGTAFWGIYCAGSNNVVNENIITNTSYGIAIDYESASNNEISCNDITQNYVGLDLFRLQNQNCVWGNSIMENKRCGIQLRDSINTKIYHNNFVDNAAQVSSQNSTSKWDEGYPSGGNYWSNYTGADVYSGCFQNESGSDGIGDAKHVIDGNNEDRYPLMALFDPSAMDPYHLIVARNGFGGDKIDPGTSGGGNLELIGNVYETLISFDRERTNSFLPRLATSWETSQDGLTYTFTIRQGVKFHNGGILTTEDVEYSMERILVMDNDSWSGPLLYDAFFGLPIRSRDEQNNIVVTAQQLDDAVTRNATTVTFHLTRPYPPFLQILCVPMMSILNKAWCVALGEWPQTWNDWTYYNRNQSKIDLQNTEPPGPHVDAMCGTGPYMFDYFRKGVEYSMTRFDDYWGGWPRGLFHSIQRVTVKRIDNLAARRDMFLAGQLDIADIPRALMNEVLGQPGVECIYPLPRLEVEALLFNFNISTSSPFLGIPGGLPAGTFSENGIPPDFFEDINVRKGFAYAFNYTQLIDEALLGEAFQPATPIIPGLPYYNPDQEKYTQNLTKAREFLETAWSGQLWANGFNVTVCYWTQVPTGWAQLACENLKANIEGLNPKFHINTKSFNTFDEFWRYEEKKELPILPAGWLADFADPHNFALAYMGYFGFSYTYYQSYRNSTIESLVDQGIAATNSAHRQEIYYDLQRLYWEDCPGFCLLQPIGRAFIRDWVQGWSYDTVLGEAGMNYFQNEWKERIPPHALTAGENLVNCSSTTGTIVAINTTSPGNLTVTSRNVSLEGTTSLGTNVTQIKCVTVDTTVPPENITFPIEIRIYYTDQDVISAYVDQSTLRMYYWNETSQNWLLEDETGVVTPSDVQGYRGYVWAKVYHLSEFAAIGQRTLIHSLAVREIRLNKNVVGQNCSATLYADVFNLGSFEETFNVTVYVNSTAVATVISMTLAEGNSATIPIIWSTLGFDKGRCELSAYVWPVENETGASDNLLAGVSVFVTIPGDVDGNGWVNVLDAIDLSNSFGKSIGQAGFNPNADFDDNGVLNILDAITLANHYNQHYP